MISSKQVKVTLHMDRNLQTFLGRTSNCSAPFPVSIHLDPPPRPSMTPFSRTAFSFLLLPRILIDPADTEVVVLIPSSALKAVPLGTQGKHSLIFFQTAASTDFTAHQDLAGVHRESHRGRLCELPKQEPFLQPSA